MRLLQVVLNTGKQVFCSQLTMNDGGVYTLGKAHWGYESYYWPSGYLCDFHK